MHDDQISPWTSTAQPSPSPEVAHAAAADVATKVARIWGGIVGFALVFGIVFPDTGVGGMAGFFSLVAMAGGVVAWSRLAFQGIDPRTQPVTWGVWRGTRAVMVSVVACVVVIVLTSMFAVAAQSTGGAIAFGVAIAAFAAAGFVHAAGRHADRTRQV